MASRTREKVAEYLDQGLTVLEIARLLSISPQAVYKHLRSLGASLPTEKKQAVSSS